MVLMLAILWANSVSFFLFKVAFPSAKLRFSTARWHQGRMLKKGYFKYNFYNYNSIDFFKLTKCDPHIQYWAIYLIYIRVLLFSGISKFGESWRCLKIIELQYKSSKLANIEYVGHIL